MHIERHGRRARRFHAAVYIVTLVLLFTGWWLLVGREGEPSLLARASGQPDTTIHQWFGWALVALATGPILVGRKGIATFVRETIRFDRGDAIWLMRWPGAVFSGRFGRHEGHFDPGQRVANVGIVSGLAILIASGVGLSLVAGGPVFIWLRQVHTWATFVVTPLVAGHVLMAIGVLPGYRGVWRSMHLGGRVPVETARRVWPGWTERTLDGLRTDADFRDGDSAARSDLPGRSVVQRRSWC
jgi:cytochrome b subunit of formate dehydrogenase